jgi:hypothetical protein
MWSIHARSDGPMMDLDDWCQVTVWIECDGVTTSATTATCRLCDGPSVLFELLQEAVGSVTRASDGLSV